MNISTCKYLPLTSETKNELVESDVLVYAATKCAAQQHAEFKHDKVKSYREYKQDVTLCYITECCQANRTVFILSAELKRYKGLAGLTFLTMYVGRAAACKINLNDCSTTLKKFNRELNTSQRKARRHSFTSGMLTNLFILLELGSFFMQTF